MIQVVNRALNILEFIAKDRSRIYPLNEIATQVNLNSGTCANIIKTLLSRGYLEQVGRKEGYKLGPMLYMLTGNHIHKQELLSASVEPMNKLRSLLNEGCMISYLKDNMREVLWELGSSHELQVINKKEKEAYNTSTGRAILAYMKPKEIEEFVEKYGLPLLEVWAEVRNIEDLFSELRKIRKDKMAIQIFAQVIGFAVPIFKDGNIIASAGVYLPQSRCSPHFRKVIIDELAKIGDIINNAIDIR